MTRIPLLPMLLAGVLLSAGCFDGDPDDTSQRSSSSDDVNGGGDGDYEQKGDCTKIEGGVLGRTVTIPVGGKSLTVTGWIAKADGAGEYVGFTYEATGDVVFTVKAGTNRFDGGESPWVHPMGMEGPDASGISNIDFCDPDGDGGGGGGGGGDDDGDDDDECMNPDGCDSGDGYTIP
jgi:hypothetical protein